MANNYSSSAGGKLKMYCREADRLTVAFELLAYGPADNAPITRHWHKDLLVVRPGLLLRATRLYADPL